MTTPAITPQQPAAPTPNSVTPQSGKTVPVFAPDGTLGDIPYERLHEAVLKGGVPGINMKAPDGTLGVVPATRYQEGVQKGGTVVPFDYKPPAQQGPVSSAISKTAGDIAGAAKGVYHAVVDPLIDTHADLVNKLQQEQAQDAAKQSPERQAYIKTLPFWRHAPSVYKNIVAPAGEAIGANVSGMEQSGQEGDPGGVVGHAAAPLATLAATEGLLRGVPMLKNALPSKARAGANFETVMGAVKDVPIDVTDAGNTALQIKELAGRGGRSPKVVNDFVRRATDPDQGPITYQEGRDFASNASELSSEEANQLKPKVRRLVGQFARNLNNANADAATQAGQGETYGNAMREYRQASQLQDVVDTGKKAVVNTVKYGVPTAVGGAIAGKALAKALHVRGQ